MSHLLEVRNLTMRYPSAGRAAARRHPPALADVSLYVDPAEVLAVVGESGSGKTTLTRCLLGLERTVAGTVLLDGRPVDTTRLRRDRSFRRQVQAVFQDPFSSLDPRWSVRRSVREVLDCMQIGENRQARDAIVDEQLTRVGLALALADRRPNALSGGQRQRVALAAALAAQPRLLVADEPVTALDVSVQAQILNLLNDLRDELGLAVLIVSHDLGVVGHLSDRVVVLRDGAVVESGPTAAVMSDPQHPYTVQLLDAVPGQGRRIRAQRTNDT